MPLQPAGRNRLIGTNRSGVAEAIHLMKVKHAVVTSVDRDELPDGGSTVWQNTIRAIKSLNPGTTLETLIPDFKAKA